MEHSPPLIVGAGPIGLACAISARRRGLDPLVVDAGPIAASIVRYPVGMTFFTTPERLEIGGHPLVCSGAKATREEALKYYRGVARAEGIRVRTYTRLVGVSRADGRLEARVATRLGEERIPCSTLVLATGYFEHPNLIGVPRGPSACHPLRGRAPPFRRTGRGDRGRKELRGRARPVLLSSRRAGDPGISQGGAPSQREVLAPARPAEPDQGRRNRGPVRKTRGADRRRYRDHCGGGRKPGERATGDSSRRPGVSPHRISSRLQPLCPDRHRAG